MGLDGAVKLAEIAKDFAEFLAIFGGVFVLIKWIYERHDRSTEVLFKLEEKFNSDPIRKARALIEEDSEFKQVGSLLVDLAIPDPEQPAFRTPISPKEEEAIDSLDELLRFYVFLLGIKKAHQAPDSALSASYRYYLCHYYSRERRELRIYINRFWPTLMRWLVDDRQAPAKKRFYDPEFFGFVLGKTVPADDLSRRLKRKVLVVTGSGISAESNIPTFRDTGGYWRNYDPKKLATKKAFLKNPELVWEFYLERRGAISQAQSNEAHRIVAEIAKHAREFLLITQNVDDLHERNELLDESKIVHIHGRIDVNRCNQCSYQDNNAVSLKHLPHCPIHQEEILRPGVVWFDEELDPKEKARIQKFLNGGPCDLVLVIGTSALFSYIVNWSLQGAAGDGVLIEINPEETKMSAAADEVIRGKAVDSMKQRIGPLLK